MRRGTRRTAAALLLSGSLLAAAGCSEDWLAPEPAEDSLAVFDVFWSEIDAYYAYFAYKPHLDWNAIGATYRARIGPGTTPAQLAQILGQMILELRDGHADLVTPYGGFFFDFTAGYPANHDPRLVRSSYLTGRKLFGGGVYEAGFVTDGIGYVWIQTMDVPGTGAVIDEVLQHLSDARGIIVDVRSNGGGTDLVYEPIAQRFADQRRHYRTYRYRNGPGHHDFADAVQDYIAPAGRRFEGPVALLTSRRTFSAAEGFVSALRPFPQVLTVGDTTGGGAGNPITRELPNGWLYRIPRWVVWTADGLQYEGVGLPPDIPLGDADAEIAAGRDPILERAIEEIRQRLGPAS